MEQSRERTASPMRRRTFLQTIGLVGGAGVLAVLGAAGAAAQPARPEVTIRFASLFNPDHSASRAADRFAELVARKTAGR